MSIQIVLADDHALFLGRVEALLGVGRTGDAQRELEPLLEDDLADGWILAAGVARVYTPKDYELASIVADMGELVATHRRLL